MVVGVHQPSLPKRWMCNNLMRGAVLRRPARNILTPLRPGNRLSNMPGLMASRPHASSASPRVDMPTSWHPLPAPVVNGLAVAFRTAQAAPLHRPDSPN